MSYQPFPATMPELSSYQGQLIGNRKPEYPPPLVCDTCNQAIGLFYDDTELMKNAIEYLKDEK